MQLLEMFATIGIGPGLTDQLEKLDEASKRGLARAAEGGRPMVEGVMVAGVGNRVVNGWLYPPPNLGRLGVVDDDFRCRAIGAAGGIICHDAAEAVYVVAFTDSDGLPLDGNSKYVLHFEKGKFPSVNAFWSVTAYDKDGYFILNPLKRQAIGDRDKIQTNQDGSLDLYVQSDSRARKRIQLATGCQIAFHSINEALLSEERSSRWNMDAAGTEARISAGERQGSLTQIGREGIRSNNYW